MSYPTFRDGKRTIDFILVYKVSALSTEAAETKHKTFIKTLETLGLQLEQETFSVDIYMFANNLKLIYIFLRLMMM